MKIFFPIAALNGSSSTLAQWFDGDEGHPTTGGQTGVKADPHVQYEYTVAVYDKDNKKLYLHDPRIIIGTGGKASPSDILHDLNSQAKQLDQSLQDNHNEDVKKDLMKLQEIIDDLEKHIKKP